MPSVSIITAVRNNATYVGQALASVTEQQHADKELIVVDGGSTDGTLDKVKAFGPALDRIVSEPDRGIYDALNKGIALATGDVVGFLHSDDVFDASDVIATVARQFEDSDVDAVYGDLVYVNRADGTTPVRVWKSGPYSRLDLLTGWMPPHPAFFMRRQRYIDWGGFDIGFRIAGDYDALLRYLWKYRARTAHIAKVITRMRLGGISNRSVRSLVRKSREDMRALERNGIPTFPAIALKPLRKVGQFWSRRSAHGR